MIINTRIIYAILFYVLLIVLIVISKPSVIFEKDGTIKPFGIDIYGDGNKTMFSLGIFSVTLAVVSFYIFAMIDMIFGRK